MSQILQGPLQGGQRKLRETLEANSQNLNEVAAIFAASGQDLVMRMGDNAGVNKVSFTDSDGIEVSYIDSNGNLSVNGNIIVGGTVDGVDIATIIGGVTEVEMNQIENIGLETISAIQWGYIGALNQSLTLTSSPTFVGLTLSSDLVTTSTVDGRDISADGTKLDGIESNATADQTQLDIETLGFVVGAHTIKYTDAEAVSAIESTGVTLASGKVISSADEDLVFKFGKAMFQTSTNNMQLQNRTFFASNINFAIQQKLSGLTTLNSATGQNINLSIGNVTKYYISSLDNKLVESGIGNVLSVGDVDDTPVNGATTAPVSSNWAYDHAAVSNALLMYGSANATYIPCLLVGSSTDGQQGWTYGSIFSSVGSTDQGYAFKLTVPTVKGTLSLTITDLRIQLFAADSSDYITQIRIFGNDYNTNTLLYTETDNFTSPGVVETGSGLMGALTNFDASPYVSIIVFIQLVQTTTNDVGLTGVELKGYYS